MAPDENVDPEERAMAQARAAEERRQAWIKARKEESAEEERKMMERLKSRTNKGNDERIEAWKRARAEEKRAEGSN